jgi:hypothetical protein
VKFQWNNKKISSGHFLQWLSVYFPASGSLLFYIWIESTKSRVQTSFFPTRKQLPPNLSHISKQYKKKKTIIKKERLVFVAKI